MAAEHAAGPPHASSRGLQKHCVAARGWPRRTSCHVTIHQSAEFLFRAIDPDIGFIKMVGKSYAELLYWRDREVRSTVVFDKIGVL
jgi:hypothetical protein